MVAKATARPRGFLVTHCPLNLFGGGVFTRSAVGATCWLANWPDGLRLVDQCSGVGYVVVRYQRGESGAEHQRLESDDHWLFVATNAGGMVELPVGGEIAFSHRGEHRWQAK